MKRRIRDRAVRFARHPVVPLLIVVTAGGGGWLVWSAPDMRQNKIVQSAYVLGVASLLAWAWCVLLGPLSRRGRLVAALLPCLLVPLLMALFRIEGVDGDLFPEVRPRWSRGTVNPPHPRNHPAPTVVEGAGRGDYPQFLGPQRNGVVTGAGLADQWSTAAPREVWRRPVGEGWSAFSVAGRRAVTQEQHGPEEWVVCYDLADGTVIWVHRDDARYSTTVAGTGPRATATLAVDRVVTMGATGILNCLNLANGTRHWSVDVLEDNGGANHEWGMSGSPLVVKNRVVVNPAGTAERALVAYALEDGAKLWTAGGDQASYSSPAHAVLCDREQIVIVNARSVSGHEPETGRTLWRVPWPGHTPKVAQPVPLPGNRLFVSASYTVGCAVIGVQREADGTMHATMQWSNQRMKAKFANLILHGGLLYGLDEGILACLDPDSGRRRWKSGRYGHGQLLCADGTLLVQCESGEVALVEARPDHHAERGRLAALHQRTWNSPALAGRTLLVRNHREAACYELPARNP